ncbi:MAG: VOC family protein [Nocardioides sp.]
MADPNAPSTVQVVIDCLKPHRLAEWWGETLGWDVEPQDADFIRSMVAQGLASQDDTIVYSGKLVWAEGCAINPPAGESGPRLLFQKVPEPKTGKNRVHLDLRSAPESGTRTSDDHLARVDLLVERGATVIGQGRQGPHEWTVLTDPEGNEFCVPH